MVLAEPAKTSPPATPPAKLFARVGGIEQVTLRTTHMKQRIEMRLGSSFSITHCPAAVPGCIHERCLEVTEGSRS